MRVWARKASTALAPWLLGLLLCGHALAAQSQATLQVSVRVAPRLRLDLLPRIHEYAVTRQDIERGFLDLRDVAQVAIRTNNPQPIQLFLEVDFGAQGLQPCLQPATLLMPAPGESSPPTSLSCRVPLNPTTRPGTYRVRLNLSAMDE